MNVLRTLAIVAATPLLLLACVGDDAPVTTPITPEGGATGNEAPGSASTPTDAGGGGLAPDATPSLGCPLGCLPPAPAGWLGPGAVYDGPFESRPTACAGDYTRSELEAHDGMKAVAECTCGAAKLAGGSCNFTLFRYNNTACSGLNNGLIGQPTVNTTSNRCEPFNATAAIVRFPSLVKGTCSFDPSSPPAPTFEKAAFVCALPQIAACRDRPECTATPAPAAPFTRLCIHRSGRHDCPSQDYPAGFVTYAGVDDKRACSTCTGTPEGTCGTTWAVANAGCTQQQTTIQLATCTPAGTSLDLSGLAPKLTCKPAGASTPSGSAEQTEPVTVCCNVPS